MKTNVFRVIFLLMTMGIVQAVAQTNPKDRMTFAVMGNSISTYEGYLPSGYAVYYATYRGYTANLQVGDTWWMQLSRMTGMTFLTNSSWSGSRVATTSDKSLISAFTSDDRINSVGRAGIPDAIIIAGGTNDWSGGKSPLGEYSTTVFDDSLTFRGAYTMLLYKLKKRYPNIILLCSSIFPRGQAATQENTLGWTQNDANESIKHIAEQFGGYYIDCTGVPLSNNWKENTTDGYLHPSAKGHKMIAECMTQSLLQQGIITADLKQSNETEQANRLLDLCFEKSGIVNKGTYQTTVGKAGNADVIYDKQNDTYLGCTQKSNNDYFYALYDADSPLGEAFNNSVTWETLVRLENLEDANNKGAIMKFFTSQQDGGWTFYNTPNYHTFAYLTQAGVYSQLKCEKDDSTMVAGKYYHLVVTMDRTSHIMRYFVNGQLVATGTRVASDLKFPNCGTSLRQKNMWIGLGGDPGSTVAGSAAESGCATTFVYARIYDGALTIEAAKNLYDDYARQFTEPQDYNSKDLLLDACFTETGAVNMADNVPEAIEEVGNVTTRFNSDLNRYEASFNSSTSNFFKFNLGSNPLMYNKMSDAYTLEIYCNTLTDHPAHSIRPVSSLDGYGTALHMNAKGNIAYGTITYGSDNYGYVATYPFKKTTWSWTGDGTLKPDYTHYAIVYDRKKGFSRLYIDGVEKLNRTLNPRECCYFEWAPSDWLAIGGTAKGSYETTTSTGSYPFDGTISTVRLWSKALSADDVKEFSQQAHTGKTFTFGNSGYMDVCLPYSYLIPDGCAAYKVISEDYSTVTIQRAGVAGQLVPKGSPVILSGTTGTEVVLKEADPRFQSDTVRLEGNLLTGTYAQTNVTSGACLLNPGSGMFQKYTSVKETKPNACWLQTGTNAKLMRKIKVDLTPVHAVPVADSQEANIYDINGIQVNKTVQKGIYIKNRSKYLNR